MFRKPSPLNVAVAIGTVTLKEIVRDRILYNAVLAAGVLLAVSYLASQLIFMQPERVVMDFGLSAMNLSCSFIAILIGAVLVSREFERRTIFVILSKPLTRFEFLIGKYAGLTALLAANWTILGAAFLAILIGTGGAVNATLVWGLVFVLLQSLVLGAIAILVSSFSTTSISVICSIGLYLIGNNISEIRFVANRTTTEIGRFFLESVAILLPNFEHFNLGSKVPYGFPVPFFDIGIKTLVYAIVWILLTLVVSGFVIHRREI